MPKPYNPHDKFMLKAKAEGYRARSVYKLEELDKKFNLVKPGMQILDLAAAPGSWMQYMSEKVGPEGKVVGVDLQQIAPIADNTITYEADINDLPEIERIIAETKLKRVDLITSDIAPNTSGIPGVDSLRSIELNQAIVKVAEQFLKQQGVLVMKIFDGPNTPKFLQQLKPLFGKITTTRVNATRDRSSEFYAICINKKPRS